MHIVALLLKSLNPTTPSGCISPELLNNAVFGKEIAVGL